MIQNLQNSNLQTDASSRTSVFTNTQLNLVMNRKIQQRLQFTLRRQPAVVNHVQGSQDSNNVKTKVESSSVHRETVASTIRVARASSKSSITATDEREMELQKVQSDDKTQFRVRLHRLANRHVLKRGERDLHVNSSWKKRQGHQHGFYTRKCSKFQDHILPRAMFLQLAQLKEERLHCGFGSFTSYDE